MLLAGCTEGSKSTLDANAVPSTVGAATVPAGLVTPVSAPAAATGGYVLGPGDKLRILVFNENEMSREYEVDTAGKVTLPLIGAVQAAGKSPSELQEVIRSGLKQGFIRDPKVSIEVLSYRPFYIIGEVTKAGEYPYKNGMNVVSAVATAGGYSYRADTARIYIRRATETAEKPYDAASAVQVMPGDIIRVPERYF